MPKHAPHKPQQATTATGINRTRRATIRTQLQTAWHAAQRVDGVL